MSYTNVMHVSNEHQDWLRALEFYKHEINVLENRLAEVLENNNSEGEFIKQAEHFQNQFIIQKNNIDELRHYINENLHFISREAQAKSGEVNNTLISEHNKLKGGFESFEKVINELRREFNQYIVKWISLPSA